ncbi:MAG: hypothetical protein C9356_15770 [Oleiphilus sp.]|nr:MAG: hypothetical protein C9356_15770 [Oleiphilus sp.]
MKPLIIVVDDESQIIEILREDLEDERVEFKYAESFESAHGLIASLDPLAPLKAIITDQHLKDGVGNDLLDLVKVLFPGAFRVLISGANDVRLTLQAVNSGLVHRYITKSKNIFDQIEECIDKAMGQGLPSESFVQAYQALVDNRCDTFAELFASDYPQYRNKVSALLDLVDTSQLTEHMINRWLNSDTELHFRNFIAQTHSMAGLHATDDVSICLNHSILHTISFSSEDWLKAYSLFNSDLLLRDHKPVTQQ